MLNSKEFEKDFSDWKKQFLERAAQAGVTVQTLKLYSSQLQPDPRVHEKQSNQTEFTLTISDYLNRAVPEKRVRNGRAKYRSDRDLLNRISAQYGVGAHIILAIWGVETNYGATRGDWPVLSSLATLAHCGHRASFFEGELIAALKILEAGDIDAATMRGSWAGAMGHGQFLPTSFLKFAVDNDGDGRRDIWGDKPEDGLASIANYLSHHGWRMSQPSCIEICLPEGFDYALAGLKTKRAVSEWSAMGIVSAEDGPIPDYGDGSVLLPSGATGPAFMTFGNFEVILTYNRAEAYGVAVAHLADRLQGGRRIKARCPDNLVVLKRDEMRELQELLTNAGYNTIGTDGFFGPNTASALRSYQTDQKLVTDGFGSGEMLDHLRRNAG